MEQSAEVKSVMGAMMKVQQSAEAIKRESTGQVGTRNYKYADLLGVWEQLKALLQQNGLVVMQSPTVGASGMGHLFATTVYHVESGEWIRETMAMVMQKEDPQGMGSAITYYRRYMLMAMFGLVSDDDSDAREHRLATAEQKMKIVGAVKQLYPDLQQPKDIIDVIMNIVGKHPTAIREDEAERTVDLIKAFKTKGDSEE